MSSTSCIITRRGGSLFSRDLLLLDPTDSFSWELHFGCPDDKAVVKKLILVCVHGNEICGMNAVNSLLLQNWFKEISNELKAKKHRVKIILANPQAVKESRRFVDINLNRIFKESFVALNPNKFYDIFPKDQNELNRLHFITKAIEWADFVLDIHSTSANTPSFVLCPSDPDSEKYAASFPVEYVIKDLSNLVYGTTIEWAKTKLKTGICVECGQHTSPHSVDVAMNCIKRFLTDRIHNPAKNIISCHKKQMIKKGFHFLKKVCAFQKVHYKEVLGEDDCGPICCPFPNGAIVIMPNIHPIFGEEAWFWGVSSKDSKSEEQKSKSA